MSASSGDNGIPPRVVDPRRFLRRPQRAAASTGMRHLGAAVVTVLAVGILPFDLL